MVYLYRTVRIYVEMLGSFGGIQPKQKKIRTRTYVRNSIDCPSPVCDARKFICDWPTIRSSKMTSLRRVAAPLLLILSTATAFVPSLLTSHRTSSQLAAEITLDGETIRGPITPLGNFVLVQTKDTLAATSGGILLPDQVCLDVCSGIISLFSCCYYYDLQSNSF